MIRVPTPLIDSVRELSRLHREGQTPLLLEGLQALIVKADSSAAIKVSHHDETLHQIVDLLQTMRHQLEKVEIRLARLEAGQSRRTGNLRYVPPIPQQAEFQTFEEENLAKRLGVDVKTIIQQRATNSPI
jgi:hypothetical protein